MLKTLLIASLVSLTLYAVDYDYKKAKDFQTLSHFKSVEAFEKNYQTYVQNCLDNTYGGTGGIPCYIGYDMWDRELNIYYGELMKVLPRKLKDSLQNSQREWLTSRNKSENFIRDLINEKYEPYLDGTMYQLMSAGDYSDIATMAVKERALQLRALYKEYTEELN